MLRVLLRGVRTVPIPPQGGIEHVLERDPKASIQVDGTIGRPIVTKVGLMVSETSGIVAPPGVAGSIDFPSALRQEIRVFSQGTAMVSDRKTRRVVVGSYDLMVVFAIGNFF